MSELRIKTKLFCCLCGSHLISWGDRYYAKWRDDLRIIDDSDSDGKQQTKNKPKAKNLLVSIEPH